MRLPKPSKNIPEALLFAAKAGDRSALDELWELCRPFCWHLASKWGPHSNGRNSLYDIDDLRQAGYLAFRKALEKWKPVEGVNFIVYYDFWLAEYFRREIGISNSRRKELLFQASSLNERKDAPSDDKTLRTVGDHLEDDRALKAYESIEDFDFARVLREQVEKLPDPERKTIKRHHFSGVMLKDIAVELGVSTTSMSRYLDSGYRMLRKNKIVQMLYAEIRCVEPNPYEKIGLRAFRLKNLSSQEWIHISKEQLADDIRRIFLKGGETGCLE